MLSSTADYALRAILVLALEREAPLLRAEEIAARIGAPRQYLAKTLHALARAGLVTSTRGPLGGFALAVAPESLTLARVVDLFDEPRPSGTCLLGNKPCDVAHPCVAHRRWTAIRADQRAPLANTTIADLLQESPATVR